MKQGKNPTRRQKGRLERARLSPADWLIVSQRADGSVVIQHRYTNTTRIIPASVG
ncbi:MAG: hypothetical protein LUG13_08345 [Oscillospiraceae bacterium]|nr:hypothetical protein [Oscillospiraceae bacterium]